MTHDDFRAIVERYCEEWMAACPSINSVGIGAGPSLHVGLREAVDGIDLPNEYMGIPVVYKVMGSIVAY